MQERTAPSLIPTLFAAVLLLIATPPGASAQSTAPPAARPSVSAKLVAPLKRAQDAIKRKDWQQASWELDAADLILDKSEYDVYVIGQMRTFVNVKLKPERGTGTR